jgi:hypothetical protein
MPIPLPDLDDKSYDDLVEEARATIPQIYPAWTDHNPSDPGITLLELFAWLSEVVIYRVGRIPDSSYVSFLKLLNGPDFNLATGQTVEDAIRATLSGIRERYRAVTADDFEYLVQEKWAEAAPAAITSSVKRVKCIPEQNLAGANKLAAAPGYVSLLLVPDKGDGDVPWVQPSADLKAGLADFFKERMLITTRLVVTGPDYVPLTITATLYLKDFAIVADVKEDAAAALKKFYSPVEGGDDQKGWSFGADVLLAKIYAILDGVYGVDFTEDVSVSTTDATRQIKDGDELLSIRLQEHELPYVDTTSVTLTLMARRGDEWKPV